MGWERGNRWGGWPVWNYAIVTLLLHFRQLFRGARALLDRFQCGERERVQPRSQSKSAIINYCLRLVSAWTDARVWLHSRVGRACDRPADTRLEGALQEHIHNSLGRLALATVTSRAMRGPSHKPALATHSIWSRSTVFSHRERGVCRCDQRHLWR